MPCFLQEPCTVHVCRVPQAISRRKIVVICQDYNVSIYSYIKIAGGHLSFLNSLKCLIPQENYDLQTKSVV